MIGLPDSWRRRFARSFAAALLTAIGAAVMAAAAFAQPPLGTGRYHIDQWQSDRGVRGDLVLGPLIRTPDGYLWMRTVFGLTRFDGVRFTTFNADNTPALEGSGTSQRPLLLDGRGRLWVATSVGLASYESGRFARGPRYTGGMLTLAEDRAGRLWSTSTTGKLFHAVRGADGERLEEASVPGLPSGGAVGVAADAKGRIWVGFDSPGVASRITPTAAGSFGVRTFTAHELGVGEISAVGQSRTGSVWIAGTRGVTRIDEEALTRVALPPHTEWVSSITEGRDGVTWFGSYGSGVLRYAPQAEGLQRLQRAQGLSHDRITGLLVDAQDDLWVATVQGLNRVGHPAFSTVPPSLPVLSSPGCFARDDQDTLWLASEQGELFRGRAPALDTSLQRIAMPPGGRMLSLSPGRHHTVWVARGFNGLWRVANDTAERVRLRTSITEVRVVFEDSRGALWLGTEAGAVRVRNGDEWRVTERDGSHSPNVHHFVEGPDGAIWAGGTEGLIRIVAEDVRAFRGDQPSTAHLALRGVAAMRRDSNGAIWVGTQTGITRVLETPAGPRFASLRVKNGLPENWVTDIVEDGSQRLWLVGLEGIARIPLDELNAVADGRKSTLERVAVFAARDGLPSAAMAAGGNCPRALRAGNGDLWFSLARGVAFVDPRGIQSTSATPQTHIEEMWIDGARAPLSDRVSIPAGVKRLELHYTGVDLRAGEAVRFQYRLEGFDPGWMDGGTKRTISYTNLEPRAYRFVVRARSAAGLTSETPATLSVVVLPPFYRTSWFIGMVTMVSIVGIWVAHRARERVVRARFEAVLAERSRVAREMHDTLLSGVAGVALRLDVASSRAPHEQPSALASELAEMRDVMHRMLQDARRAVGDLRRPLSDADLSSLLENEARRTLAGSGIELVTTCDGQPPTYPPEVQAQILRIIQEALINARTHSRATAVALTCVARQGTLTITVRDDGGGFANPDAARPEGHWGLVGMRERAEQIDATVDVSNRPGEGVTVTLRVPFSARLAAPSGLPRRAS
jgi:signal transduction histidine kinase/ligand-binding sensor domain-containing protein